MRPIQLFTAFSLGLLFLVSPFTPLHAATESIRMLPSSSVQRGALEGKKPLPISMNLTRTGTTVRGTYQYLSKKKPIYLDGTQQGALLRLNERATPRGPVTAVFEGTVRPDGRIEGSWKNTKTKQTLPFHLEEMANRLDSRSAPLSGTYQTRNKTQLVDILPLDATHLKIQGSSEWDGGEGNVNVGTFAGIATLQSPRVFLYTDPIDPEGCHITLTVKSSALAIDDTGACGGLNTTFTGTYQKIFSQVKEWDLYNSDSSLNKE